MFEVVSDISNRAWLKQRDFQLCTSLNQLHDYVFQKETIETSEDWETTSLNVEIAKPVGIGVSVTPSNALYVPVGHLVSPSSNLRIEGVLEVLREIDGKYTSCWWGYKYDGEVQRNNFAWEPVNWLDVMFAAYLENPNINVYGLKPTAARLLGLDMITFEEVTRGRNFAELDPTNQETIDYGCSDVAIALEIRRLPTVARAISNDPQWGQVFIYELERKVDYCIRDAERNKCWIDREALLQTQEWTKSKIRTLEAEIFQLAGDEFDLNSPPAMGKKLEALGVHIKERTPKSDQPVTKKEVLEKYKQEHPVIERIIQWKEIATQCRNYIDKLVRGVDHFGPHIKFVFHHTGVPTGRMKAGGEGKGIEAYDKGAIDLNTQSIPDPKKQPYLPNIRAAYVANDPRLPAREFLWVSIDYAQLQARIAANLSREPVWIKSFLDPKEDLHCNNARLAYRDPKIQKSDPRRDKGKTLTYAMLFGGSEWTVHEHGGISVEQAKILVDNFFGGAPKLKSWIDGWIKMAQRQRFIKTPFGRIRPLTEYYPEGKTFWQLRTKQERRTWAKGDREAVNGVIQGAEADIFKIACVKVRKLIEERNWQNDVKVILFEHDELDFIVRKTMLELVVPELQKAMEFEVKGWPVPLKTDVEIGYAQNSSWGHLISYSDYLEFRAAGLEAFVVQYMDYKKQKKVSSVAEYIEKAVAREKQVEDWVEEGESEALRRELEESIREWQ